MNIKSFMALFSQVPCFKHIKKLNVNYENIFAYFDESVTQPVDKLH